MAVAKLVDLGYISSINDDICNVLPSTWGNKSSACRNPYYPNYPITWRMLLTHRSGLTENIPDATIPNTTKKVLAHYAPENVQFYGIKTYGNPKCPLTDVVPFFRAFFTNTTNSNTTSIGGGTIDWYNTMKNSSINYGPWTRKTRPDRRYIYSNVAYGYIAALIELVTKQSYESFCQKYIFEPLQMNSTSWFRETLLPTVPSNQHAMPVQYNPSKKQFIDYGHNCYIDYASGQLYTTVTDLSKFLTSMFTKGVPTLWNNTNIANTILSCADSTFVCRRSWKTGYGWVVLDNQSKKEWNFGSKYNWTNGGYHFGGTYGVSTVMMVLPESKMFLSVLTNVENANVYQLASRIVRTVTNTTN